MIEQHYGFSAAPFRLSPDPRFFYRSREHGKAMAYLRYGLQQGEGFIIITGEVGAGKSTLVQQLLRELDRDRIVAGSIVTTNVEADDALRLILTAFDLTPAAPDKAAALSCFEEFLRRQHRTGRRVLLIVDEAQNLPKRTIEELRMLSNFQIDQTPPLQIFLVGQPQFQDVLADPDLEQLRQRVIASQHLGPISLEDTRAYIEHRLRKVGWTGTPAFSDGAIRAIRDATDGVPRRINTLCARILLFGALEDLTAFDTAEVEEVVADLHAEVAERPRPRGGLRAPTAQDAAPACVPEPAPVAASETSAAPPGPDDATAATLRRLEGAIDGLSARLDALEQRADAADAEGEADAQPCVDLEPLLERLREVEQQQQAEATAASRQREVVAGVVRILARLLNAEGVAQRLDPAEDGERRAGT